MQCKSLTLENSLKALMFPAIVGILTAVIFFGALIGFFNLPAAESSDVLPSVYMPARLQPPQTPIAAAADIDVFPSVSMPARLQPPQTAMSAAADIDLHIKKPVIIQAYIDATGKVQDYQI